MKTNNISDDLKQFFEMTGESPDSLPSDWISGDFRSHLTFDTRLGDIDEFFEDYPEFCKNISDIEKDSDNECSFSYYFENQFYETMQEDDLFEFLKKFYNEIADLRDAYAAEMEVTIYFDKKLPVGMITFDPEIIGLCAGLGISLKITSPTK